MNELIFAIVILFIGYWGYTEHKPAMAILILSSMNIVFWGLGYNEANDTVTYMHIFEHNIPDLTETIEIPKQIQNLEYGFIVLSTILKTIVKQYCLYQFVLFGTEFILIVKGLRKILDDYLVMCIIVALSFTFQHNLLNALRQGLVIAAFIYSIQFIISKHIYKYFACIIASSFFHTSALVLLPIYFLGYIPKDKEKIAFFILICVLFIVDVCFIFHVNIYNIISNYASYLSELGELSRYKHSYFDKKEVEVAEYGIFKFLEMNLVYILSLFLYKQLPTKGKLLLYIFAVYMIVAYSIGGRLSARLCYFFVIAYYSYVVFILDLLPHKMINKYCLLVLYLFGLHLLKFNNILAADYNEYYNLMVDFILCR